jgi:hypothetical protein
VGIFMSFVLYHTLGCHLCDLAQAIVDDYNDSQSDAELEYRLVDIASDDSLVEKFGLLIPVLENSTTQQSLGWPFDLAELSSFILAQKNFG